MSKRKRKKIMVGISEITLETIVLGIRCKYGADYDMEDIIDIHIQNGEIQVFCSGGKTYDLPLDIFDVTSSDEDFDRYHEGFMDSSKLVSKITVDKACEWLSNNLTNYESNMMGYIHFSQIEEIIKDFRKSMVNG